MEHSSPSRINQGATGVVLPKVIPQLDGLRAFAILIVLVGHSSHGIAILGALEEYAFLGVDLFFVLSGFLITGILLDQKGTKSYFLNFYARRGLRIWPLYYAFLVLVFVLGPHIPGTPVLPSNIRWEYFAAYLQNVAFNTRGEMGSFTLAITWSLAIEEQFYLIWPMVVHVTGRRTFRNVAISVLFLSALYRLVMFATGNPSFIKTLARADELAIGALIAYWLRSPDFCWGNLRKLSAAMVLLGCCGTVALQFLPVAKELFECSVYAAGFGGLLGFALCELDQSTAYGRILSTPGLRYIGKISYGLYLLHPVAFRMFRATPIYRGILTLDNQVLRKSLVLAGFWIVVLATASASWYLFEQPILRLKSKFDSVPRKPQVRTAYAAARKPEQSRRTFLLFPW